MTPDCKETGTEWPQQTSFSELRWLILLHICIKSVWMLQSHQWRGRAKLDNQIGCWWCKVKTRAVNHTETQQASYQPVSNLVSHINIKSSCDDRRIRLGASHQPLSCFVLKATLKAFFSSTSFLWRPTRGWERQALRKEERPLRDQLHGAVPVQSGLHSAPSAHHPVSTQRALGRATDILYWSYVVVYLICTVNQYPDSV